jgi:hypothetical protein
MAGCRPRKSMTGGPCRAEAVPPRLSLEPRTQRREEDDVRTYDL